MSKNILPRHLHYSIWKSKRNNVVLVLISLNGDGDSIEHIFDGIKECALYLNLPEVSNYP